ncbi:MAG: RNA polymerase sigma factor [Oscillospiraceae bacterium]|jgi:RNA polymerase sigma-70 factor (ECF subfamily)|nr:RNA polymerase sigma factor [Oscillospiraceae bacterium]
MAYDITILTRQAKAGDAEAFGALYESLARDLYRFALYSLGSEPQARDAVQEAALAAFRGIAALRSDDAFRPWMFRILRNACRKSLRQSYGARAEESLEERFSDVAAGDPPLGRALEVRQAISNLPGGAREVVIMHVLEGYDSREIGRMLGCAPGTVRSRLSRAMEKLRKELDEHEEN